MLAVIWQHVTHAFFVICSWTVHHNADNQSTTILQYDKLPRAPTTTRHKHPNHNLVVSVHAVVTRIEARLVFMLLGAMMRHNYIIMVRLTLTRTDKLPCVLYCKATRYRAIQL